MGRTSEAMENFNTLASQGYEIAGQIEAPGTLEGVVILFGLMIIMPQLGLDLELIPEGIRQLKK